MTDPPASSRAPHGGTPDGLARVGDEGAGPAGRRRDESFPPAHRITREQLFRTLLARGFRFTTPHLIVHVLINELGHSRLGLTLPRKVGKAVLRNQVRRRLRESFRRTWRFAIADKPADVLVRAQPNAGQATFAELRDEGLSALTAWRHAGFREGGRRPRGGSR